MAGASVALVAVLALAVVAGGSAAPAKKQATPLKIAVITDIGGLNDKGFNSSAYNGLKVAQRQYGVKGRVFISKSAADYVPNLSTAAKQGYNLIIAVGFLMGDSTAAVAKKFPKSKFAIVDVSAPGLKGKPKNVRGIIFAEEEAGCLAGVAAATVSQSSTISSVGGLKIPPVDAFIAGYQFCAKKIKPGITTLNAYSQDFVAQDKCKEVALNQIGQSSDVVFQVAGQCGLGAITAAGDSSVWGIGVDNDQAFLGPQVLTSAVKKVDAGVTQTIKLVKDGKFKGGVDALFNVKNGGTGFGKVSATAPNRTKLIATLNAWAKQLADNKVNPPRTVK
jgi:basic membrane protein A